MLINKFPNNSHHLGPLIVRAERLKKLYFSFELTSQDEAVHKKFITEVKEVSPLFYASTWHMNASSSVQLSKSSLDSRLNLPQNTLIHLIARNLTQNVAKKILDEALEYGKTNIFILRGDDPTVGEFNYTVDFIKFVKQHYNEKFCIATAGYPDQHPESTSKQSDLYYLKLKVDAGASFIITQIVYDADCFIKFVEDCKQYGIHVPIIPGIMPIYSYESLIKMSNICKVKIPDKIHEDVKLLKDNNQAVYQYGMNLVVKTISDIICSGSSHGFHLFTLNRSAMTLDVCRRVITELSNTNDEK